MLPDGKFRYSLEYVSVLLGHGKNYFSRLTKNSVKKLKSLQRKGFTGYQLPLIVSRSIGGATYPETYSFDDFCIVVEYEAQVEHNPKAIALLTASFRELLRERSLVAFDLQPDTFEEKLHAFDDAIAQRLEWITESREELEGLWLPGDEVYYPVYEDWKHIQPWQQARKTARKIAPKQVNQPSLDPLNPFLPHPLPKKLLVTASTLIDNRLPSRK